MINRFNSYKENIINKISDQQSDKDVFLISGDAGLGKSRLIEEVIANIKVSNCVDGILNLKNDSSAQFLPEFLHGKTVSIYNPKEEGNVKFENFPLEEIEYNYQRFNSELQVMQTENDEVFQKYYFANCLKSSHSWAAKYLEIKEYSNESTEYVKQNYQKKSIIRLLTDTYAVSSESIVVNLMNLFFPINSNDPTWFRNITKKKVVICLDEFDDINGSIYMLFLSYLLPYFYNKSFADFVNYKIDFLDKGMKVTDFFDFKIIIASRNNFDNLIKGVPEVIKSRIEEYKLTSYTTTDYAEVVKNISIPEGYNEQSFYKITMGIPALMFSGNQKKNETDNYEKYLNYRAFQLISKNFVEYEVNMLYLLPFMKEVDRAFLQCVPEFNLKSFEIENFLLYNSFMIEKQGTYIVKPEILDIIKDYVRFNAEELFTRLNKVALAVEKMSDVLNNMAEEELEILEVLAFMPKDNHIELSSMLISLEAIKEFYKKHRGLFLPGNNEQFILKDNYSERTKEFLKDVNNVKYQELTALPAELSSGIAKQRESLEVKKTAEIKSMEKEKKSIDEKIKKMENEFKNHQTKMISTENEMIEKRRLISDNSYSTNIMVAVIGNVFAFAVLLVGIFLPNFVNPEYDNSPIYSIQFIMYCIFAILLVISIYLDRRAYKSFKTKEINSKFNAEIELLEQEKIGYMDAMQECKDKIEELKNRKKEINSAVNSFYKKSNKK